VTPWHLIPSHRSNNNKIRIQNNLLLSINRLICKLKLLPLPKRNSKKINKGLLSKIELDRQKYRKSVNANCRTPKNKNKSSRPSNSFVIKTRLLPVLKDRRQTSARPMIASSVTPIMAEENPLLA